MKSKIMRNMLNNIRDGKLPIILGSIGSILGEGFTQDLYKTIILAIVGASIGYFVKLLWDILIKKLKKSKKK